MNTIFNPAEPDMGTLTGRVYHNVDTGIYTYELAIDPLLVNNVSSFNAAFGILGFNGVAGYSFSMAAARGATQEVLDMWGLTSAFDILYFEGTDQTLYYGVPAELQEAGFWRDLNLGPMTFFYQSTLAPGAAGGTYNLINAVVGSAMSWAPAAPAPPTPSVVGPFFLSGSGATANPDVLFLDSAAPSGAIARYKDSAAVWFIRGNPWKAIGTWAAAPSLTEGQLDTLSDLHVWLGLKSVVDLLTRFDLRAEVYKNGTLVAQGETRCITGLTRNPTRAKVVTTPLDLLAAPDFDGTTDALSLKLLTRIGTHPDGTKCSPSGLHGNATGLRLYFDAVGRESRFEAVSP